MSNSTSTFTPAQLKEINTILEKGREDFLKGVQGAVETSVTAKQNEIIKLIPSEVDKAVTANQRVVLATITAEKESGKTNTLLQFLKDLGGAAVILSIPLYIGGWTYLQAYYKGFGLRMTELGFSLYDILVYSIPVLLYSWWATLTVFVLLLVIGIVFKSEINISDSLKAVIFVVLYVLLIVGASKLGGRMGSEDSVRDLKEDTTTLPYVAIEVDPEKVKGSEEQYAEYNSMDYTLLLSKNSQYYVFAPLKQIDAQDEKIETKNFEITVIPSNLVNLVRIQRGVALEQ